MKIRKIQCTSCGVERPVTLFKNPEDPCSICELKAQDLKASDTTRLKNEGKAAQRQKNKEFSDTIAPHDAAKALAENERKLAAIDAQKKAEFNAEAEAKKELAQRELARRRYLPFVLRFVPKYQPGWVHKDICKRLEQFSKDVADKKSPRLMLFMPPRHGKSELTSKTFAAWHLGHYPDHEFISCSYSGALSMDFSRRVRSIIRDPDYPQIFPDTALDKDSQSVETWRTQKGGGFVAAGVGGAITGKGAHILLIDDPVKNREEAESDTTRQSIKGWYTSTAYTRLAPGGGVLVILTRWHDDDLAGWLLEEEKQGSDKWEVVKYPAIAENDEKYRRKGEALHADRYPLDALKRIQRAVGPRDWEALYQQNPVAMDGDFFKVPMFRMYRPEQMPNFESLKFFTAWDLAIGQKQHNDYTVGITVGIDANENMWLVDLVRGQYDALQLANLILDVHKRWNSAVTGIEKGQIEMSLAPLLRKRVKERRQFTFSYEELSPGRSDKVARARSIQGRALQGMVYVPELAPWAQGFINECLRFPNGVHDDQVDAFSWLGIMLDRFFTLFVKQKTTKSWRDKLTTLGKSRSKNNPMLA